MKKLKMGALFFVCLLLFLVLAPFDLLVYGAHRLAVRCKRLFLSRP